MQSSSEKTELFAPVSGQLVYVNLSDNQKVTKGSTLVIIDRAMPQHQMDLLNDRSITLKQQLEDAEEIINEMGKLPQTESLMLKTRLYAASWQQYIVQFQNAIHAKQQAERTYLRYQTLFNKNAATLVEFEEYKFNYEQALLIQQDLSKKYINQWQLEANQYRNELRDLQHQKVQLNEQIKQYKLKATLNGSIQNLTGLQKGTYVYANQKLGEINPDKGLFAYLYVKPSDVGLLKKGLPVRIRVDAFNHNQWGVLTGKIIDISDDVITKSHSPFFKIKCELDRNYLQLKNGYKGYVKKGMSLKANFILAERSLYQLLYDNVDDWINANG